MILLGVRILRTVVVLARSLMAHRFSALKPTSTKSITIAAMPVVLSIEAVSGRREIIALRTTSVSLALQNC